LLGSSLDHLAGIGGSGRTRAEASAAALGEALERYSATYVPHDRLVVASATEFGDEAVDPQRFALFSDRQYESDGFPFDRFTASSRIPWVRGWSIRNGRRTWLPAELVYLGDVVSDGSRRLGYATSSGTACGTSLDEALARALCEVVERDAFMIVWANRLSLPLVDADGDERLAELERRLFAPAGLRYSVVDLSCFHRLPSVLAVVRAPEGFPGALGLGAGTAPTLERAWWKALAEAFASRSAGAKLELIDSEPLDRPETVVSFEAHIRYYADHAHAPTTAFLDGSDERVPAAAIPALGGESVGEQVRNLSTRVDAAGSTAYAVDVTSPDVRELGLFVVKVVAPELCSLDVVHGARFLGGRRLYDAPVELGLRSEPLSEDDLNPEPHPFP
jgi:ribosomal protein S12 methylthiotransferase accessory factor